MDPDPAAAARLFQESCDGGNALGCNNLGYLHEEGIGMEADPEAAAGLYQRGCDLGREVACDRTYELAAE